MLAPTVAESTAPAAVPTAPVPGWAPAALTGRGVAAARLSDLQDCWAELTQADRAWFAHWLTALLVDACQEEGA